MEGMPDLGENVKLLFASSKASDCLGIIEKKQLILYKLIYYNWTKLPRMCCCHGGCLEAGSHHQFCVLQTIGNKTFQTEFSLCHWLLLFQLPCFALRHPHLFFLLIGLVLRLCPGLVLRLWCHETAGQSITEIASEQNLNLSQM